jgi:DNA-3-methyladenine glycosylase I
MAHGDREQPGKPNNDSAYFEEMTKAVFRSGFSWDVIEKKWPGFREAFGDFDIEGVAAYDERDLERLTADEAIVRNARKIQATIDNARAMQALIEEHGSFHKYLRSMDGRPYRERAKALTDQFSYLGRTGTFTFLWFVGEEVPDWDDR